MSVNNQWVRSEDNEKKREADRQVAVESLYWTSFQSVLDNLLPVVSAELFTTTLRMYAFYGVDRPPSSKHIELLGGPAYLAAFRASVAMSEQMRMTYNDYTPLASAMKRGSDALASDSVPCRSMIVITDGEGTSSSIINEGVPEDQKQLGEEIAEAERQSSHDNWEGVIELIGYKVWPLADIEKLLRFHANGWRVAPHLVNDKLELDALLKLLRTKYALG